MVHELSGCTLEEFWEKVQIFMNKIHYIIVEQLYEQL